MITFPPVPDGEALSVSATLYVIYRSCPQQALARLQGVYPPETIPSFRGSLAHRLFARHLTTGPIESENLPQACREEIGARDGHLNMKLTELGLNRPSNLARVVAEVGDLYERFRRLPTDRFRDAEVRLEAEVAPGVMLRGRVDAIFDDDVGAPVIVDWKTGIHLDDAETQLDFYAMAWAMIHDELPARAEAVSIPTGERVAIEPSIERAREVASSVASMVGELRGAFAAGTELERSAGPWCRWCPLLEGCREGTAAVEVLTAP